MNPIREFFKNEIGISYELQHKIIISVFILVFLWVLHLLVLRIVWKQSANVKIRYNWKRFLSLIFPLIGIFFISGVWLPAFHKFGAFLGLLTAGLAIALKDPLANIAGWFFIMLRKPFVVGDRIQIGNHAGDIIDIRLFQFTILEIGNWVDADQSTGRIIHLPNSKVFMEPQANYSSGFNYIWNEIPVVITFESNWQKAKKILEDIINLYSEDISEIAGKEIFEATKNYMIYYSHLSPIVYTRVVVNGVRLTIRYLCEPRKRRGSENELWQKILSAYNSHADIRFAYPTTRFYRTNDEGEVKKADTPY
ncbi:MAG: mechanosensitive ion channel protein MscS [Draconibacterium sp.]|nr:MAG: mechanosensitive ion channel protein MscS [Draconibacterium sp.]